MEIAVGSIVPGIIIARAMAMRSAIRLHIEEVIVVLPIPAATKAFGTTAGIIG